MRISTRDLNSIQHAFKKYFGTHDHLWVFGSRVDDTKKGGDIDLYIETQESAETALKQKLSFINDLWRSLGEQRIDVVLNVVSSTTQMPIFEIAKQSGVKIV